MSAAIFDSHKYVQRLRDAGVSEQAAAVHAETILEVMNQITDNSINHLNTKVDQSEAELNTKIDRVAAELNNKIDRVESELRITIERSRSELLLWILAATLALFVAMTALHVAH